MDMEAIVKNNTNNYHIARLTAAVYNTTVGNATEAVQNISTAILNSTVSSPAPAQKVVSKAATSPSSFPFLNVAGDETLFATGDGTWAYGDKKYAIPALIIVILLILSGVGLVFIYRRRRQRATPYSGLKESELNSVQMHRS